MTAPNERISFVDSAKAIGIFLVFYGHIVERLASLGSKIAFAQLKFIFSFHMPFFFIIAGFFFRRRYPSKTTEIQQLFIKRIYPVLLFGLIALPIWPLYRIAIWGYVDIPIFSEKILPYLKGRPELNEITWFLVCLFTTEVIAVFVLPRLKTTLAGLITAVVFLGAGLLITEYIQEAETLFGVYKNTWYIHEAVVAFGLYTLGHTFFEPVQKMMQLNSIYRGLLLILFLGVTLTTFNLNSPHAEFVVVMKESWHGQSLLFLLSALSGTLFLLFLSSLISANPVTGFLGQNTLILLGINGMFHAFINLHVATRIQNLDSTFWVTGASLGFSVISILLSVPLILILNKYLPQLIGKPHLNGPLLPRLDRRNS